MIITLNKNELNSNLDEIEKIKMIAWMTSVQRSTTAKPRSTKKNLKIFNFCLFETSCNRYDSKMACFILLFKI